MIKSVIITNHLGESLILRFSDVSDSGFFIKSIDGLGPVEGTINISNLATIDGGIYNSARKNSRNIVLDLVYDTSIGLTVEELRHKSYKYFRLKTPIVITIITDKRELKTFGYVETNEQTIFSEQAGTQISILCPNSDFVDANAKTESYDVRKDILELFTFPFANRELSYPTLYFGEILGLHDLRIDYDGDSEHGVDIVIRLNDNIMDDTSNPDKTLFPDTLIIEQDHLNTDIEPFSLYLPSINIDLDKLRENDQFPKKGDTIRISTSIGNKKAMLNDTVNLMPYISSDIANDFNWFKLFKGTNIFRCYIDKLNIEDEIDNTKFDTSLNNLTLNMSISYDIYYEGV